MSNKSLTTKKAPTYQQLFKDTSYYTVDPARSVLSPAAYFVDLMNLVQKNITNNTLKSRRPDLWKLILDKQKTDTEIPKIEIVNQVLENYLSNASEQPLANATYPSTLSNAQYPFALPYNQSLDQTRHYLAQNQTSLPEIWSKLIPEESLNPDQTAAIQLETLGISSEQWMQYCTPIEQSDLGTYYGYPGSNTVISDLGTVQNFLTQTTLNYENLEELIYQDLSPVEISNGLNNNFFINADAQAISIQDQSLQNLSAANLDRIDRFVRLAQAISWSFTDLDWALQTIGTIVNGDTPMIDDKALPYLAWMQGLKRNNGLTVDQCCALIGTLKDYGQKNGQQTFFDQVFNNPDSPIFNWSASPTPLWSVGQPGQPIQSALAAALQINLKDLTAIGDLILKAQNITGNTTPLSGDRENLAILYRLSLLPKITKLPFEESLTAANIISQSTNIASTPPAGTALKSSISTLGDFTNWLEHSPFSVYQLEFILTGKSSNSTIQNKVLGVDAITNFFEDLTSAIEKTLLTEKAFSNGITSELQSLFSATIPNIIPIIQAQNITNLALLPSNLSKIIDATSLVTALQNTFTSSLPSPPTTSDLSEILTNKNHVQTIIQNETIITGLQNLFPKEGLSAIYLQKRLSLHTSDYIQKISGYIYTALTPIYLASNSVVLTSTIDNGTLEHFIEDSMLEVINSESNLNITAEDMQNVWPVVSTADLITTITTTLKNHYQLQQKTFVQHISALYKVPTQTGALLKDIGDLNIETLIGNELTQHMLAGLMSIEPPSPLDNLQAAMPVLQKLQQAAELIKTLSLSPTEVEYFKPTITYPIQLVNVQTMLQLKELVVGFQDTQNNLLNILKEASDITPSLSGVFNGSNDYINIPAESVNGLDEYTIETWVKLSDIKSSTLISKQLDGKNTWCVLSVGYGANSGGNTPGTVYFHARNNTTSDPCNTVNSNTKLKVNTWYHLAIVVNTSQCDIYINGTLDNTTPGNYSIVNNTTSQINTAVGAWIVSDVAQDYLKGTLYRISIWNVAKKSDDIKQLMNVNITGNESNLICCFLPGCVQQGEVIDISKNKYNGKVSGNITKVSQVPPFADPSTLYEKLSELTAWNLNSLTNLVGKLSERNVFTVNHTSLLKEYFDTAERLGIDTDTLWNVTQLPSLTSSSIPTKATSETNLAQALWGGLQSQYQDLPQVLTKIQGKLNERLRDKLVPLAMSKLSVTTPRGLYEHLLIDVEVSANVQTSYVKEAISAVQLYVYRCLNQLESGATVEPALSTLWEWMYAYREWQANKEVFLYPEDYIQPELRKNKTDLFAKAEASLKQANLSDPQVVEKTFREYMNGFAEIANLQVVGTAAHSLTVNGINTKQLCMVGMTRSQPHQYYWRVANFALSNSTKQYEPTDWGQWEKFNIKIQPVKYGSATHHIGALIPVFAFGKWYAFWVEQKLTGSELNGSGSSPSKTYTVSIHYSHLDFSNRWVPSQELTSIASGITPITNEVNSIVHPIYFASIQTLYVPYNAKAYKLAEGTLGGNVSQAYRFVTKSNAITGSGNNAWLNTAYPASTNPYIPALQYCIESSEIEASNAVALSTWFKVSDSTEKSIVEDYLSVQAGHHIFLSGCESNNGPIITEGQWYHLAISDHCLWINGIAITLMFASSGDRLYKSADGIEWTDADTNSAISGITSNLVFFQNAFYAGVDTNLYKSTDGSTWTKVAATATMQIRDLVVFNNTLYAGTWGNGVYKLSETESDWEATDKLPWKITPKPSTECVLCTYVFNDKLYAGLTVQRSGGINAGAVGHSNNECLFTYNGSSWTLSEGPTTTVHALCVFNGTLYASFQDIDGTCSINKLMDDNTWGQINSLHLPKSNYVLAFCVFNDELYAASDEYLLYKSSDGDAWHKVLIYEDTATVLPKSVTIFSLTAYSDALYVGTAQGGYKFDGLSWTLVDIPSLAVFNHFYTPLLFPAIFNSIKLPFLSQETLYFSKVLNTEQVKGLYKNSLGRITDDFSTAVSSKNAFSLPLSSSTPILGQPNWDMVRGNDKSEYLTIPYESTSAPLLNCYRLNTTAIHDLAPRLNLPAGINALLSIASQRSPEETFSDLVPDTTYIPAINQPISQIDFTRKSAMENYYWELFFHLPFLIANELSTHQRFAQARKWLQYIFNPEISKIAADLQKGDDFANDQCWQFLGLRSLNNPTLEQELTETTLQQEWSDLGNSIQLAESDTDPFDPQGIASLRPIAYQKTMVMHYVKNLLDWGDMLYKENTRESIVEAEMFYVAAYDLLGQEPTDLGPKPLPNLTYYSQLPIFEQIVVGPTDITCIYDFNGKLYIGTESNGLYFSSNGSSWVHVGAVVPAISNINLLYAFNGTLYAVTTSSGIFSCTVGTDWIKNEMGPVDSPISCLCSFNAILYAGTNTGKLYQLVNGTWSSPKTISSSKITALLVYSGVLYAGTENIGLYLSSDGSSWVHVSAVAATSNVNLLYAFNGTFYAVTTSSGIFSYTVDKGWVKDEMGPVDSSISCLSSFNGILYAGTNTGELYQLVNGTWSSPKTISSSKITALLAYSGVRYAGTEQNGLYATEHYFGISQNTQFLSYWDTIKQRLYNIRHGLTINGQTDDLPLFQPPVNPMALVAAVASGESVAEAIHSSNSTVPYYRFDVMIEKAKEITQTVIKLGKSLLYALEKKDAQALAMLYNTNRQHILQLTQTTKQDEVTVAKQNIIALGISKKGAQARLNHYNSVINAGLLPAEEAQIGLAGSAIAVQAIVEPIMTAAILGYSLPTIFGFSDGGFNPGEAVKQGASILETTADVLNKASGLAGTVASYQRREKDWELQKELASSDIDEINYHIVMAQYQQHLVEQKITILDQNIKQENKVADFYLKKFTNEQLYQWYIGQVSTLYFQAYQLALDVAMQAENGWNFEHIGLASSGSSSLDNFIKPGYWNRLHEGLLAGESLLLDLQRMEKTFMDQNARRLEITKTISLALLDPSAIMNLIKTGSCTFDITAKDFAFDFPGYYCRQIKSISVSIPMILGSNQNIHATLTQLINKLVSTDDSDGINAISYLLNPYNETTNKNGTKLNSGNTAIKQDLVPNQQVALSQDKNDTGMFEMNFDDPRYLPFEGTGAISSWQLEMPLEDNAINFESITDVIIDMKYTALPGSLAYKQAVAGTRDSNLGARGAFNGTQTISLAQEFLSEWRGFNQAASTPLLFPVDASKWRGIGNQHAVEITKITAYALVSGKASLSSCNLKLELDTSESTNLKSWSQNIAVSVISFTPSSLQQNYTLTLQSGTLPLDLTNIIFIISYSAKPQS